MDFSGSLETLDRYRKLFPWGRDVSHEVKLAEYWRRRLGSSGARAPLDAARVEERYRLWLEFEESHGPWQEGSLEEQLQRRYFSRLADSLAAGEVENSRRLPEGTPDGLIFVLAGRHEPAIDRLQELLAAEPENARLYGYLGDAYHLRGDLRTARICYREAFVLAPAEVDLRRLRDRELTERLAELRNDDDLESDHLEWFPVKAQLDGLFEPRLFRDLEELRQWLRRYLDLEKAYLDLEKAYDSNKDQSLVPQLFYHAMVLSDNSPMMKFIKKPDLPEVRRRMKEWHPALFARHMRELNKRRR